MVFLFYGEDAVACEQSLDQLQREAIPSGAIELAVSYLDGDSLSFGTLMEHCEALPFLSPKRLVVVEGIADQLARKGSALLEQLQDYLPHMAGTTLLVFRERTGLPSKHPLVRLANRVGEVREFSPPRGRELSQWIGRQVRQEGAEITPAACDLLAATVGTDSAVLLREVEKLVTYVGPQGKIDERLVVDLASAAQLSNIFALVDAIGQRRRGRALLELQRLFHAGQHPLYVLTMIVRQFRLLLQVKGLPVGDRQPTRAARLLSLHPFVAEKVVAQAELFQREELERVYRRLVQGDREIKTGQRDGEVALELLVVEITAPTG